MKKEEAAMTSLALTRFIMYLIWELLEIESKLTRVQKTKFSEFGRFHRETDAKSLQFWVKF